jgi:hypothetical protein
MVNVARHAASIHAWALIRLRRSTTGDSDRFLLGAVRLADQRVKADIDLRSRACSWRGIRRSRARLRGSAHHSVP